MWKIHDDLIINSWKKAEDYIGLNSIRKRNINDNKNRKCKLYNELFIPDSFLTLKRKEKKRNKIPVF